MPKPKGLAAKLKGKVKQAKREPLWKGPEVDGITFSLLCKFLVCRERFKLYVMDGWRGADEFRPTTSYGDMWHICEEAHNKGTGSWEAALHNHRMSLKAAYPLQQEQINHWYDVCHLQFQLYRLHWAKHPDVKDKEPIWQEKVFDVPYRLPSGRMVRLRGKFDSVDWIKEDKTRLVYLQENKTKGDLNEQTLQRQLTFDLQTMMYIVALKELAAKGTSPFGAFKVAGVRYNVIRRPLSGGLHSIRKHKGSKNVPPESDSEFYARLGGLIQEDIGYFFMRWKVGVSDKDVVKFRETCLDPLLEQLCEWYDFQTGVHTDWSVPLAIHYRMPYGVYNPLTEGRMSDLDDYLETGSTVGLKRVDSLFRELG